MSEAVSLAERRQDLVERVEDALGFAALLAEQMRDEFGATWEASDKIALPYVICEPIQIFTRDMSARQVPRHSARELTLISSQGFDSATTRTKVLRPDAIRIYHVPVAIGVSEFDDMFTPTEVPTLGGKTLTVYTKKALGIGADLIRPVTLPTKHNYETFDMRAFLRYPDSQITAEALGIHDKALRTVEEHLIALEAHLDDPALIDQ